MTSSPESPSSDAPRICFVSLSTRIFMKPFVSPFSSPRSFSETDTTADLKKFDMPTLILPGDDDQIVPIGASAMLSSTIGKNATLKVYKGAPHGMCTTLKDQVNSELLDFIKG